MAYDPIIHIQLMLMSIHWFWQVTPMSHMMALRVACPQQPCILN